MSTTVATVFGSDSNAPRPLAARIARVVGVGLLSAAATSLGLLLVTARGAAAQWDGLGPLKAAMHAPALYLVGALVGLGFAASSARRAKDDDAASDRVLAAWTGASFVIALLGFMHPLGRHAAQVSLSVSLAILAGALWPVGRDRAVRLPRPDLALALGGYALTVIPMCVFPMHRHWAFGSGSWDMGCYVHNAYLVSRFLPTISTVLGGADFLGDHFSVGLYLYAPLFWLWGSGYALILLNAMQLAVTTPAVYGIARAHGASRASSLAVGLTTGLSFGLQSAAFFDVHAITLGFGFFAAALWAIETRRLVAATLLLFTFSLFKESIGLYIVGLGLWLLLRSVKQPGPRRRQLWGFGAGWVVTGALWFVVVNRVLMPWFRSRGSAPEPHETYTDFGPTVFEAALAILSDPLAAAGFMFVGDEKLLSWFATFANAGWLTFAAPSVLLAAAPLFAERFLSAKSSMWHMGYHYAAPLCLYAGWGAARAAGTVERWIRARSFTLKPEPTLVAYLLALALFTLGFGYRHPANFLQWRYAYYSSPAQREANAEAVAWLREAAPDGKVAAQNRLLPHVASRRYIYRLEQWERADWVLLSLDEDAWPYDRRFPRQLADRLDGRRDWSLVFERSGARIYRRGPPPSPAEDAAGS